MPECSTPMRERVYCHPQTDCFGVSQLFRVARYVGRLKLGSKPTQLYVRLSIRPLGQQAYHVGKGIIKYYVATATHEYLFGKLVLQINYYWVMSLILTGFPILLVLCLVNENYYEHLKNIQEKNQRMTSTKTTPIWAHQRIILPFLKAQREYSFV